MNKLSLTAVAGGLIVLASCSQEEVAKPEKSKEGMPISFRAGVDTRVNPAFDYSQNPQTFYVTAYKNSHKANNGVIPDAYFKDEPFYQMGANIYSSTSNQKWPAKSEADHVEFFAYAPSLEEIQSAALTQLNPLDANYNTLVSNYMNSIQFFNMCNDDITGNDPMNQENSTFNYVKLYKGFKLGRFYVATDISKQVDFITAHISADTPADQNAANLGVDLKFKHQLSNIELRAFSGNAQYNIEIAGVRIGSAYTGAAIFNFCDADGNVSNEDGGQWGISKQPQRLPVEYIYTTDDSLYRMGVFHNLSGTQTITSSAHTSSAQAGSIMGLGGNAMVLPTKNGPWEGEANPWIATKYQSTTDGKDPNPWSADNKYGDMYFSILLRVTLKPTSGEVNTSQIYPYGNNTTMNVVYLEKEINSNKIIGRVPSKQTTVGANSEILEFGWATVPVGVNWERGKKYIYTLDFSKGVGIQDPEDPKPGAAILGSGITFSVSVVDWDDTSINTPMPAE